MRPLLSPEEMGRADDAAIAAGTPGEALMERAGRAIARAAVSLAGGRYRKRAHVFCGTGNNGGDGFVAARVLARQGLAVDCYLIGDREKVRGDARTHLERTEAEGIRAGSPPALGRPDVIVDALFGTGFRGALSGDALEAVRAIVSSGAAVVAADIPSGVAGATGAVEGEAVRASVTIAMGVEKVGTATGPGAAHAGRVIVADIGIPIPESHRGVVETNDVSAVLPRRDLQAHKRSAGAVALIAGSPGMSGAAALAARGAMRMGAGYVTAGVTAAVDAVMSILLPEVLTRDVGSDLGPGALGDLEGILASATALAIGPGLGSGDAVRKLVQETLHEVTLPLVVDADGLNALAEDPRPLAERSAPVVITPHPGELARLRDTDVSSIEADRIGSAESAAATFSCTVLLKGARTVVADPAGGSVVVPAGGPELATAGTGDVLTGAIAALLAAGLSPFEAAWAAAFVHGRAGELLARATGTAGVLAWDVAESLPQARAALER